MSLPFFLSLYAVLALSVPTMSLERIVNEVSKGPEYTDMYKKHRGPARE